MEDITDVKVEPLVSPRFVHPFLFHFKQHGAGRLWELVKLHDSVAIVIFNTDRQKLIFVRQFRPAVYFGKLPADQRQAGAKVDPALFPGSEGVTLELCAGIVDKDKPLSAIAKDEVLEECGYDVPLAAFHRIKSFRNGVGVSGEQMTLFYVEVQDKMKVSQGGGVASEGEMIEVVELDVDEVRQMVEGPQEVNSPSGLLFALSWFLRVKAPK